MARTTTLASLRSRVRQRADVEHDEHIGSDELDSYIDEGLTHLTDLIVEANEGYLVKRYTVTTAASSSSYSLPSDFYKPLRVDLREGSGSGDWCTLSPFALEDEALRSNDGLLAYGLNCGYRLVGQSIELEPPPQAAQTLRLTYVNSLATLTGSADTFDGQNGWDELAVCYAAMSCLQKQDRDVSTLLVRVRDLEARVRRMVGSRASAEAPRVIERSPDWDDEYAVYKRFRRWVP